ncbi:hypothetical protein SAMN05444266_101760 [Chitinophaga jiangningensis]|uniref:Uncharacterized protein n=1 Tax=Chitinophaga jiangningensis TaxID=1419482 RepID=A0A1M6WTV4_9BACT|nr:hypothetical protein SAMN05444266_101760 [Chitinophaga jiangningensis]
MNAAALSPLHFIFVTGKYEIINIRRSDPVQIFRF